MRSSSWSGCSISSSRRSSRSRRGVSSAASRSRTRPRMLPEVLIANFALLLQGAERTLYLSAATALFSSAIGLVAALLRVFGWWPFRVAVDVYVYVVRGVPLLL